MEIELLALCVKITENALHSPLGVAVNNFIEDLAISDTYFSKTNAIITKLKKNQFEKPEDFLAEYNESIEELISFSGVASDLSVAIQSIQQQINEEIGKLIQQPKTDFSEATKSYVESIRSFLPNIPDDQASFEKLIHLMKEREYSEEIIETITGSDQDGADKVPEIHFNPGEILQLKQKIQCIDNDENLQKIGQIVRLNEENAVVTDAGNIEFDLFKCNKYTIKLIRDMIAHASIKLPPTSPIANHNN